MNVSLTPAMARMIAARVKSGEYASASEVVRTALRGLAEHERARRRQLADLRRMVREGIESAERGGWIEADEVFRELRKPLKKRKGRAA